MGMQWFGDTSVHVGCGVVCYTETNIPALSSSPLCVYCTINRAPTVLISHAPFHWPRLFSLRLLGPYIILITTVYTPYIYGFLHDNQ